MAHHLFNNQSQFNQSILGKRVDRHPEFSYGAIGGGTIVAPYVPFIEETLSAPIPEADTYLLLLTGLGLVGFIAARRGKL